MLSFQGMVWVTRGEDKPLAGKWRANGRKYRTGAYTLAILRGDHPDEPERTVFDHMIVEPHDGGAVISLPLTAEQVASAQGAARPEIEHLVYRLRHDGDEICVGLFSIHPRSSHVEALRSVCAPKVKTA